MMTIRIAAVALLAPATAAGAATFPAGVTPVSLGATYAQTFDTLATTGTSAALPAGWQVIETGGNANATYAAGTGSGNAGGSYSFGAAGSTDRALGSIGSGTMTQIRYGAVFANGQDRTITSIDLSYVGEQWRRGTSTDDGLRFEYSLDATGIGTGSWTAATALDFLPVTTAGAEGALNGNLATSQRTRAATLSGLSIAAGGLFAIRWTDVNSGGNDHGLAIDTLALTTTLAPVVPAVPEPAGWAMMIVGFGVAGLGLRRRGRMAVPGFAEMTSI